MKGRRDREEGKQQQGRKEEEGREGKNEKEAKRKEKERGGEGVFFLPCMGPQEFHVNQLITVRRRRQEKRKRKEENEDEERSKKDIFLFLFLLLLLFIIIIISILYVSLSVLLWWLQVCFPLFWSREMSRWGALISFFFRMTRLSKHQRGH